MTRSLFRRLIVKHVARVVPSRALVGLIVIAMAAAACGGGEAALPGTERNPGTTTLLPTTPTSGSQSSTTSPPTTVQAEPPNSQTTQATTAATVVLGPDGLGVVSFGVSLEEAVTSLTAHLGEPTSATPATELPFRVGDIWADADDGLGLVWDRAWYQTTCWEQLCAVHGGDSPDGLRFTGWFMSPLNQGRGLEVDELEPVPLVATSEGTSIGSTAEELRSAYPGVEFSAGEGASALFDIGWTPAGFTGIGVVGPGRLVTIDGTDVVFQLAAGDGPRLGCC